MTSHEFERILKKLKGHGHYVYLHIKGEPMLHPEFFEILEICRHYDMKVNLTTNGTLLEGKIEQLVQAKALRQVSFSLQSQENQGNVLEFDAYMTHILSLIKRGIETSDILFELRLWNYEGQASDASFKKNTNALTYIKDQLKVDEATIEGIPMGQGRKLMPQVYLSKAVEFAWPDINLEVISSKGTCYGLRQQVGILVNGDVVPCCLDSEGGIILGNIFEQEFEAIVTSDRAKAMVEGFEQGVIKEALCQRCGYRSRFS